MSADALAVALTARLAGLLPPERQPRPGGAAADLVAVLGALEAQTTREMLYTVYRWLVETADEAGLALIGEARYLRRYSGEYLDAYRNRVLHAFDFWEMAGTLPGMYAALEHLGYGVRYDRLINYGTSFGVPGFVEETPYTFTLRGGGQDVREGMVTLELDGEVFRFPTFTVAQGFEYRASPPARIYEHFHDSRDTWAEFSVYLAPGRADYTTDAWDDGGLWDDGSLWDTDMRAEEIQRVVDVLNLVKSAHTKLRALWLVRRLAADIWDDGTLWDDSSTWEADPPVQLYP